MNKAQWAMIRKDVIEITGSSQTIVPLVLVPLLIMVIFPAALMVGAQFGQSGMVGINGFDQMVRTFGDLFAGMTPRSDHGHDRCEHLLSHHVPAHSRHVRQHHGGQQLCR